LLQACCPKRNADSSELVGYCTSTGFAIFELIKFMCFGSTLSCPHEEFLNPRPSRTRTQSSAGTPNPRGITRLAQDSNTKESLIVD